MKEDGSVETLVRKSRPLTTLLKFNIIYGTQYSDWYGEIDASKYLPICSVSVF